MAEQLDKEFQQFQDIIDQEVKLFGDYVLPFLKQNVQSFDAVSTGELLSSLRKDFVKRNAQAAVLTLAFNRYGTATETKKRMLSKKAPASELFDWVEKMRAKGEFKKIPGYKSGKTPTESQAVNRIVWGIKNSKRANRNTKYVKQWFYRPFYAELKNFTNELSEKTSSEIGKGVYRLIDRSVQQMNKK